VAVSTIAALSARLSGTRSFEPFGVTASRSGHASAFDDGGKSCAGAVPAGAGTGRSFRNVASPCLSYEKTWFSTIPCNHAV
jgi:hypothetical protein